MLSGEGWPNAGLEAELDHDHRLHGRQRQVRSDNQQAMEAASVRAPMSKDPVMRRLQAKVRELLKGRVHLRPRWVKGHRDPKGDVTAWLNAHCDREAKRARRGLPPMPLPGAMVSPARAATAPAPATNPAAPPKKKRKRKRKRRKAAGQGSDSE